MASAAPARAAPRRPAPATRRSLILVRPQLADNIGMVARAMANFGLEHLRLVAPRDGWPNEKARIAASGANFIIDEAQAFATLGEALAGLNWVCATTARQRDLAKPVLTPEQAVAEMRRRLGEGPALRHPVRAGAQRPGDRGGRQRRRRGDGAGQPQLRLAQPGAGRPAGELRVDEAGRHGGTLGRVTTYEEPLQPGLRTRGSPPATKEELLAFFEHLERELEAQGFFTPPEKRPSMVQNMRTMFTRMGATEQEIRTLRGIVKALVHGKRAPAPLAIVMPRFASSDARVRGSGAAARMTTRTHGRAGSSRG